MTITDCRNPTVTPIDFPKNSSEVFGRAVMNTRPIISGERHILVPEDFLLDQRFSLGMRAFATWAWGQSITWVFRVEDIQMRLGITRSQWRTLAKEMVKSGFLIQTSESVPGSVPIHNLRFNFLALNGTQSSSNIRPSREDTSKGLKMTTLPRGEKQPLTRGTNNNQKTKTQGNNTIKKPLNRPESKQIEKIDCVNASEAGLKAALTAERLGLNSVEAKRFISAAKDASDEQLDLAERIHKSANRVRDPVAYAVGLAKQAARGMLTQPNGAIPVPRESEEVRSQRLLEDLNGAVLEDSSGPRARVEYGRLRSLRHAGEPLLHPSDSAKVIADWNNGLLTLLRPN